MTDLDQIAAVLDTRLAATAAERRDEAHGIWRPAGRRVRRLGLALEPDDVPAAWLDAEHPLAVDALLLHRPWGIAERALPAGVGVVACHRPFDAFLTTGYNPALARALSLRATEAFGEKDGRPLGMAGAFEASPVAPVEATRRLVDIFGGLEAIHPPTQPVEGVTVARAMTGALVERAHVRGTQLYVTGQMRRPARDAVARTRIGVAAVGHRRSERFGLRVLAGLLRQRFAALRVLLPGSADDA